jgi:hypothetical protein
MNWKQIKVGAEPKKIAILVGLLVVAGISYLLSRNSGETPSPSRPAVSPAPLTPGQKTPIRPVNHSTTRVTQGGLKQISRESHPDLKPKITDPSSVDPTLHLSLLTKLQDVKVEGSPRSLFEISDHPPAAIAAGKEPPKIVPVSVTIGPKPPPPPPGPPPVPNAPLIPLKFYGFVNPSKPSIKRAFFLDGEDIVIAGEGDLIKKRYKIVRIGVNSAVVEDTTFKGNNTQQTLPLEAEMQG